jgi:hypothetical protein
MSGLIAMEGSPMIGGIIDPHDPERTVAHAKDAIRTVTHLAGYLAGLNGTDVQNLEHRGIPLWAVATIAAGAGALFALPAQPCASGDADPLSHWVSAAYLRPSTLAQMRAALARDASLQLESFLRPERLAAQSQLEAVTGASFDIGSPADGMAPVRDACVLAVIASYAQGMALLERASTLHDYQLDLAAIAQIWTGGCIIRARLLQRIQDAYVTNPQLPSLLVDPWFAEQIRLRLPGLRQVVAGAAAAGIPVPCLRSALDAIDSYRSGRLPQNLVQAMRDAFGAHTYQRTDRPGSFHTDWPV